ncbi:hypothetical protein GXM_04956 [Nostoc sphaeroides CCNUC1]|uniref:Uncharacterized protein n=1 Tax=Nostoc sphaeroides CCNUC1 TaxID=2653204 RepID=A0A5P8W4A1_9NOSO|nr:hypothetical protein GXM_04956 [Nostoc sphaeroides CCNUC1]
MAENTLCNLSKAMEVCQLKHRQIKNYYNCCSKPSVAIYSTT